MEKPTQDFCELFGIVLGDGCITGIRTNGQLKRPQLFISGHGTNDMEYFKSNICRLFERIFAFSPKIHRYSDCNGIRIFTSKKYIVNQFICSGFSCNKYAMKIPQAIMDLGIKHQARVIRGLFDTDGTFFARKDENYRYPYVAITITNSELREQVRHILRGMGFPAYTHAKMVLLRGGLELTFKWFKEIGSSHPETLKRFNEWKETGILLPKCYGR